MSYAFDKRPAVAPTELEPGHGLMPKLKTLDPLRMDEKANLCARPGCNKPTAGPVLAFCKDHSAPPVPYA